MSRYSDDYEGDYDNWALTQGRWERNSRATLRSKRGRQALADLRDALLALPEKRLIDDAVCTVGGPDARIPDLTEDQVQARADAIAAKWASTGAGDRYASLTPEYALSIARDERRDQRDRRSRLAAVIARDGGEGVCAVGALLWYRAVRAGADPAEAFAALPDVTDNGDDGLDITARLGRDRAGLAYTLAWNLAYRNDETYKKCTPEERYEKFLAWVEQELAEVSPGATA